MKNHKKLSAAKKLTLLAITIALIFISINLVWFLRVGFPYYGYRANGFTEDSPENRYSKKVGGYGCTVVAPAYLSYNGFLRISEESIVTLDKDGNIVDSEEGVTLFIWPDTFKGYEYGLNFKSGTQEDYTQVYLSSEGEYLPSEETPEEEKALVEKFISENSDLIKKQLALAKETWGLEKGHDISSGLKAFTNNLKGDRRG